MKIKKEPLIIERSQIVSRALMQTAVLGKNRIQRNYRQHNAVSVVNALQPMVCAAPDEAVITIKIKTVNEKMGDGSLKTSIVALVVEHQKGREEIERKALEDF